MGERKRNEQASVSSNMVKRRQNEQASVSSYMVKRKPSEQVEGQNKRRRQEEEDENCEFCGKQGSHMINRHVDTLSAKHAMFIGRALKGLSNINARYDSMPKQPLPRAEARESGSVPMLSKGNATFGKHRWEHTTFDEAPNSAELSEEDFGCIFAYMREQEYRNDNMVNPCSETVACRARQISLLEAILGRDWSIKRQVEQRRKEKQRLDECIEVTKRMRKRQETALRNVESKFPSLRGVPIKWEALWVDQENQDKRDAVDRLATLFHNPRNPEAYVKHSKIEQLLKDARTCGINQLQWHNMA